MASWLSFVPNILGQIWKLFRWLIGSGKYTEPKSALHASIDSKKEQSYYYAVIALYTEPPGEVYTLPPCLKLGGHFHRKRDTGEEPAPPPVHEVIDRRITEAKEQTEAICSYQFLDDDAVAKVYVALEGVGELEDSCIESEFEEKSLKLCVRGYKPNKVLVLVVRELEGEVVPEECKHRKLSNKIVVVLKKKLTEGGSAPTWRNLKR